MYRYTSTVLVVARIHKNIPNVKQSCEFTFKNKNDYQNAHICTNICYNGITNIYSLNDDLKRRRKEKKEEYINIISSMI
jgi:hypothetical protein